MNRRLFLAGMGATAATLAHSATQSRKPNLIYILADDLGYGELGCYGQTKIKTPCLDQLAAEGMRFTQHYSGAAVCAPSRFTLMTGQHIGRSDTYGQGQRLKPDAVTLPKLLKQAGYTTGAFGKWGLGNDPNHQGFDEWYGFISQAYAHFFYPEKIWVNTEQIDIPENVGLRKNGEYGDVGKGVYIHDRFTGNALEFIKRNQSKPFFLYLPFTIPHLELIAPADSMAQYEGKWEERVFDTTEKTKPAGGTAFYDGHGYCTTRQARAAYAAMVSRMDRDIGRIADEVKKLGLGDDTLIMFSSDNGPSWWGAGGYDRDFFEGAGPLRDGKGSYYEGGLRVPMIAWWPGRIRAGSVTDHISYFPDVMPTLLDVAGAKPPKKTDGISMTPTLFASGRQKQHDFLFWARAVRMGDWKYVKNELYDLSKDIGETTNAAAEHPEIVSRIKAIIEGNKIKAAPKKKAASKKN